MNKRATNAIFLLFAIAVSFLNCLAGRYFYLPFILPFVLSQLTKNKMADFFQFLGLMFISFYILYFQDFYVGIMLFVVSSCYFYTFNLKKLYTVFYLGINCILIFIASYMTTKQTLSLIVHSAMDSAIYLVCSVCIYFWNYSYIKDACSKEKPLDQKYIDVLSRLMDIAHESINTLKKIQDNDDGK